MSPFVEGVRDLLPGEIRERKRVYNQLREVFARDGYQEVATPTLEALDLYRGFEGVIYKEGMFKVVNEGGQILVLRPDLTMPIARLVATRYSKTPGPWKFSYIGTAYQRNGGQSFLLKEKTQAGVELLGRSDMFADIEVMGLMVRSLQQAGIAEPQIDIGHAVLIEVLFNDLDLDEIKKTELRYLLEEKNVEEIKERLITWQVSEEVKELFTIFPTLFGDPEEVIVGLRQLPLSPHGLIIVDELEKVYLYLKKVGLARWVTYDPTMVTGLGYYTGVIFQAYVKGYGEVLASGGRYDGLAQRFGLDIPAVGFAIEIERLITCLEQFQLKREEKEERIILQIKREEDFESLYQLSSLLKEKGVIAELYIGRVSEDYCKFHPVRFIGDWSEGMLILSTPNTDEKIQLKGSLTQITDECYQYLTGGGE